MTIKTSTWRGRYNERPASFLRVQVGQFVAIRVQVDGLDQRYWTEVYAVSRGLETWLGYEPQVCIHPGDMMHAINMARPIGARARDHAPCI